MKIEDNLLAWKLFSTVAREKSLTRAAILNDCDLGLASRMMSSLEEAVGRPLLVRSHRPLMLTRAGEALLPFAEQLVRQHEVLIERIRTQELRRTITFGLPVNIRRIEILRVLEAYQAENPELHVKIVAETDLPDLLSGRIDVALFASTPSDPSVATWSICSTATVPLAAPDYLARRGTPETPQDLIHHDIILRSGGYYPRATHLEREGERVPLLSRKIVHEGDTPTCMEMLLAGKGISFDISLGITLELIKAGRLVPILAGWHRPAWRLSCAIAANRMADAELVGFTRSIATLLREPLRERTRCWFASIGLDFDDILRFL